MRKMITQLVDDIDGGQADETVTFGLDGKTYEIDLSEHNAALLRKALDEFVTRARRASGTVSVRKAVSTRHRDPSETRAIRDWAAENGHKLSSRGRIPGPVVTAYEAAHDLRG